MIEIPSRLTNMTSNYVYAHQQLGKQGFIVGGNWDYKHGYFDYLMDSGNKSNYIRIPFTTIKGSIEDKNGVIRFGTPHLLSYEAKTGSHFYMNHYPCNDDECAFENTVGLSNQSYRETGMERYIDLGRALVNEAEIALLGYE